MFCSIQKSGKYTECYLVNSEMVAHSITRFWLLSLLSCYSQIQLRRIRKCLQAILK